jgi:hypothetical protein
VARKRDLRCRAATRLNNDAVAQGSQGPENRKSRKHLPHRNRAVDFANAPAHVRSRLRDSAVPVADFVLRGRRPALPEIRYFGVKF